MTSLSLSRAWDDTRSVMRRDGRLITAVALALLVLPGVIADLVTPAHPSGQMAPVGYWTILTFAALLIGLVGQLAIVRLALGPPLSVGQAIRHGASRLPAYLGATLLWIFPFVLVTSVVLAMSADPQKPSAGVAMAVLVLMGAFVFVAVRLILGVAVASAEKVSAVGVLRRSWALSRGHFARLFAFLILFLIAFVILVLAVSAVIGTVVKLTLGDVEPFTVAALLVSLAAQLVGALVTGTLMVMLARLYAQVAGQQADVRTDEA